jgi:hypothetical protein
LAEFSFRRAVGHQLFRKSTSKKIQNYAPTTPVFATVKQFVGCCYNLSARKKFTDLQFATLHPDLNAEAHAEPKAKTTCVTTSEQPASEQHKPVRLDTRRMLLTHHSTK